MNGIEITAVVLIVSAALAYLLWSWRRYFKKDTGGGCGCGTKDCKVPKPKIEKKAD